MSDQEIPVRALSEADMRLGMLALKLAERLRDDNGLVAGLFSQASTDQSPTTESPQSKSLGTTLADQLPEEQKRRATFAMKLAERIRGDEGLVAELLSWASADQSPSAGASKQVEAHVTPLTDHLPEEQARLAALGLKLGQQVKNGEGIVTSMLGQAASATEPQPGHGLPENARKESGRTDPARGR